MIESLKKTAQSAVAALQAAGADKAQASVSYTITHEFNVDGGEFSLFRTLFDKNPTQIAEKNKMRTISMIHDIYHEKDDLQNFKGTAWGIYNAVADFVSNTAPFRNTSTFKENKLCGFFDGYKLLDETQKILMSA